MGGQALISSVFSLLNFAVFICHGHENNNTGDSYCACVMAPKTVVPSLAAISMVASEVKDVHTPLVPSQTGPQSGTQTVRNSDCQKLRI